MNIKKIGEKEPVFIIAEAGVNHNGDIDTAKKLVNAAVDAKADAVKFQTYKTENIVTFKGKKAIYQKRSKEKTQFDMLKNLELSYEDFWDLKRYCDKKNIEFISTPYDNESVKFLDDLKVKRFKVASADLVNKELIKKIAETKKQIILSTGMATIDEIKRTVSLIQKIGNKDIAILHCTTMYPTPYNKVNMSFLKTLKETFDFPIGYSDHTIGIEIPIMAVSLGATIIEKHFTLDRKMSGPDHFASLEPSEMIEMIKSIRNVEKAFGKNKKIITGEEKRNVFYMRRGIHASRDIKKGQKITKNSIKIIRPYEGVDPWDFDLIINKTVKKDIKKDRAITWEDIQ